MTPKRIKFIQNDFTGKSWLHFRDFAHDVIEGKINPTFSSEEGKLDYLSFLKKSIIEN